MPVTVAGPVHLRSPRPGKVLNQKRPLALLMPTGHVELLNLLLCANYIPSIPLTWQKIFRNHQLLGSALSCTYFGFHIDEFCSQHKLKKKTNKLASFPTVPYPSV